ncbi:Uncharacterised protein [Mycobacteroides abscessus subsp. abscessus]|nr:Uncharacterised protein [Mycobacteroides abscessus subsp. abscessus]
MVLTPSSSPTGTPIRAARHSPINNRHRLIPASCSNTPRFNRSIAARNALSGAVCRNREYGWLSTELANHHSAMVAAMARAGGQIRFNNKAFCAATVPTGRALGARSMMLTRPAPVLFGRIAA